MLLPVLAEGVSFLFLFQCFVPISSRRKKIAFYFVRRRILLTTCSWWFFFQEFFMRVLFWKFHCPSFICFCKSSPLSLSTPSPLELENTPHVSSSLPSVPDAVGELSTDNVDDEKDRVDGVVEDEIPSRSSLKRPSGSGPREIEKGKVQWMDFLGKELVEIREFDLSESGDSDDDVNSNRDCVCVIQ